MVRSCRDPFLGPSTPYPVFKIVEFKGEIFISLLAVLLQFPRYQCGLDELLICQGAFVNSDVHAHFKQYYKQTDLIFDNFDKQHTAVINILAMSDDGDIDLEDQVYTNFKIYFLVKASHFNLFKNATEGKGKFNHIDTSRIKLPEFKLSKFSGDIKQFSCFLFLTL